MKSHKFNVEDAEKYGIKKAVILEHLRFHQQANRGNESLKIDGKTWAFIKPSTIKQMYPYFTYSSVRRWLKELEDDGIIESCQPHLSHGNHLTFYHVPETDSQNENRNSQSENCNSQNESSGDSQNESSSIVTNVNTNVNNNTKSAPAREGQQNELIKHKICQFIDKNCPEIQRIKKQMDSQQAARLQNEFPNELIYDKIEALENKKGQYKDYNSVYLTLRKWCRMEIERNPKKYSNNDRKKSAKSAADKGAAAFELDID